MLDTNRTPSPTVSVTRFDRRRQAQRDAELQAFQLAMVMEDRAESAPTPPYLRTPKRRYLRAIVKFNNANGALLCNRCRIIMATGFEHADTEHYCCDECRLAASQTGYAPTERPDGG
jgi:hypothetical protein